MAPSAPRIPQGPPGQFIPGNLRDFARDRLGYMTRCAREFGDVVALRFAYRRVVLVSHPDLIEEILVTQNRSVHKHFALRLNPLVLGEGLLTSEDDFWLRQRRLIQPIFNRSRIASYASAMIQCTRRILDDWRSGEQRDILAEMMRITLEIAAKTLFDAEVGPAALAVGSAMQVLQDNFLSRMNRLIPPPLWLPTFENLKLRRAIRQLDQLLYGFIHERRRRPEDRGDLLSLLLKARDENDGTGMSDRQLRDEAMTLFLAGHETTALALSWTWYLLAQNPDQAALLHAEVDAVLAGHEPTSADVERLPFTMGVVNESMRLYPPAYVIGRETVAPCTIGPYSIPKRTTILMSEWVVQRDPRFYSQPERFLPSRWNDGSTATLPKFAYFPFGGGPRACIGMTFAMQELVLVIATIAQRFHFRLQPGAVVKPTPTFTLRPSTGIPAIIEPRSTKKPGASAFL